MLREGLAALHARFDEEISALKFIENTHNLNLIRNLIKRCAEVFKEISASSARTPILRRDVPNRRMHGTIHRVRGAVFHFQHQITCLHSRCTLERLCSHCLRNRVRQVARRRRSVGTRLASPRRHTRKRTRKRNELSFRTGKVQRRERRFGKNAR